MEKKEKIIKWIAKRIKDDQRKHSSFDDNWHEITARKIYTTYNITIKYFYCNDNLISNACEDYDSNRCEKQCDKCKNEFKK